MNTVAGNKRVKVIILCGGQGTRIRDVADDIPKPMIRIGDQPILWHIMKTYSHYGIKDFVLCLGYKSWVIKEYILNYQAIVSDITVTLGERTQTEYYTPQQELDWRVTLAETGYNSQTGHRVWRVRKYVEDTDLFCLTYGDGVADIHISQLIDFHLSHGRIATITGVRPPGRFGVLTTSRSDETPLVTHFMEKPQTLEGMINGGYFVFDHRLWSYLNDHPELVFEQEPLMRLANDKQLVVYEHNGFWQPMDTYREWKLLNDLWSKDQAPWRR